MLQGTWEIHLKIMKLHKTKHLMGTLSALNAFVTRFL